MERPLLRRPRASGSDSGFSLLEVMFAIVVMNVLVSVTARQLIAHHQLVTELEEWCVSDPVYFVDPAADPLHRAAEVPPDLREFSPDARWITKVDDGYAIEVTAVKRDLAALTTKAHVIQAGTPR